MAVVKILSVYAVGCYLIQLSADNNADRAVGLADSDRFEVFKAAFCFVWLGVGADVPVMGSFIHYAVAHAAAHEVSLKASAVEPVNNNLDFFRYCDLHIRFCFFPFQ